MTCFWTNQAVIDLMSMLFSLYLQLSRQLNSSSDMAETLFNNSNCTNDKLENAHICIQLYFDISKPFISIKHLQQFTED